MVSSEKDIKSLHAYIHYIIKKEKKEKSFC